MVVRKGDVWWARLPPPAAKRPVVVLSRDQANRVRDLLIVAPITTRIHNLPSEVSLGPADGLPKECVANLDTVTTIPKTLLESRIAALTPAKMVAVDQALKFVFALR